MEGTIALPKSCMDATKCALCDSYLSVPPIIAISAEGKKHKCGRCKDVNCQTNTRSYIFENVAKFLTFPCTYKGCEEKIQWVNVEVHEKTCPYRIISCPVTYECSEMVKVSGLEKHFREKHTSACPFVSVFSIAPVKVPGKYSVKLTSATSNSFVIYENQNINFYDERKHCYECFKKRCSKKYHPFSQNKAGINFSKISTSLDYSSVMKLLKNPQSVTFEISLEPEETKPGKLLGDQKAKSPKPKTPLKLQPKQLRKCQNDIECPVCREYMVAPIYACKTGHSICNDCKKKMKTCPSCQAEIGYTRCFSLEAIAETIEVPCVYQYKGCPFVGKIEKVLSHQKSCTFYKNISA